MYLEFFGLKEKPFNNTPDPKFLYLTEGHREALAHLVYGVQEHKGFIVLTGQAGTGKTTLLRALLERLDESTAVAFIFNSALSFDEILEYMLEDFGLGKSANGRVQRLMTLNDFLIQRRRAGQNTVVILDEAQNLEPSTLEQIRLLSNFETTTDKLLQVLLVGQPELRTKLQLPELRQLRQRIGLRSTVPPLTREEIQDYIRSRLRVAGAQDVDLFTELAVRRIAEYADGIPRVVNMVCDHCLLIAYVNETRRIYREMADRAITYFEDGGGFSTRRAWRFASLRPLTVTRWVVGPLVGAAVGTLLGWALQSGTGAHAPRNVVSPALPVKESSTEEKAPSKGSATSDSTDRAANVVIKRNKVVESKVDQVHGPEARPRVLHGVERRGPSEQRVPGEPVPVPEPRADTRFAPGTRQKAVDGESLRPPKQGGAGLRAPTGGQAVPERGPAASDSPAASDRSAQGP